MKTNPSPKILKFSTLARFGIAIAAARILLFLVVCTCFAPHVMASTFTLFNTGVDASGNPLPGGSIDPHWSIVAGPGITTPVDAFVLTDPSPLYAQSSASGWIWVNADGSGVEGPTYTFRLTFDLTGLNPASVSIKGSWGVDNFGSINLNGSPAIGSGALSLSGVTVDNFDVFHDFTITGGFVAGINTLDFLAVDAGIPGALNVTNLTGVSGTGVPEGSSSAVLLLLGLAAILGLKIPMRRPA